MIGKRWFETCWYPPKVNGHQWVVRGGWTWADWKEGFLFISAEFERVGSRDRDWMRDPVFYCWWSSSHSLKVLHNVVFQRSTSWGIGSSRGRIGKVGLVGWHLCMKYLCCVVALPRFLQWWASSATVSSLSSNLKEGSQYLCLWHLLWQTGVVSIFWFVL